MADTVVARSNAQRISTVVALAGAAAAISLGIRQTAGVLLVPVTTGLDVSRESFSLAIGLQNLAYGLAQPISGMLTDRYGARRGLIGGGVVYACGMLNGALATGAWWVVVGLGVVAGAGVGATSFAVLFGLVAHRIPPAARGRGLAVVSGAGAFGMFAFVPAVSALDGLVSWRWVIGTLGLAAAGIAFIGGARVAQRCPPHTALLAAYMVQASGAALVALWPQPLTAVLAAVMLGGTFVGITTLGLAMASASQPSAAEHAVAAITIMFAMGQALGPALVAAVVALGGTLPLVTGGAALVLCCGASIVAVRLR